MICAGSDRRLSVLDLNAGRVVLEIEDAHSRNITGIALNQVNIVSINYVWSTSQTDAVTFIESAAES